MSHQFILPINVTFLCGRVKKTQIEPDVLNHWKPENVRYLLCNCALVNYILSPLSYRSMVVYVYSWPEVKANSLGALKYI